MKFVKRIIFLIAIVLSAFNQTANSQSTGFGIEGGLNIANVTLSSNAVTGSKTGFMVGGFADIGVSRMVQIRPGIRYTMKGFSATDNNGNNANFKLNYLEIPLLVKVTFPLTEVKPFVMAGPTLGIQLSASLDASNGQQIQSADISNSFETIDMGLFFGSGVDIHVASKTEMFVTGGYSLGLSNILKGQNVNATIKNGGFQFTGGVKFNL